MTESCPLVSMSSNGRDKLIKDIKGRLLCKYSNIPRCIKFRNKMVNYMNQHLCNSRHVISDPDNLLAFSRVYQGKKPLASWFVETEFSDRFKTLATEKDLEGLEMIFTVPKEEAERDYRWVTLSVKGTLGQHFAIDTLQVDYIACGLPDCSKHIDSYRNTEFNEFHNGKFEIDYHHDCIVGLILGYPIETPYVSFADPHLDVGSLDMIIDNP